MDSTQLGPAVGGCRIWQYADWREGLDDALRLAGAMTDKCAVAGLPNGGGKAVLPLPPGLKLQTDRRRMLLPDLGDVVDSLGGRYHVAEDVGTTSEDMVVVLEQTEYVLGLPERLGGIGEPAQPTAEGVLAAIQATCDVVWGSSTLACRSFAVHGLGQVGGRVARWLSAAGASVTAADVNPQGRVLAAELGVAWTSPEDLLDLDVDVLVPASLGRLLTSEVVSRLRCRAIVGPANNQLATPSVAGDLASRGIIWAPDVVVNAGGALYGILRDVHDLSHTEAMRRVTDIGSTLHGVLEKSAATGRTPSEIVRVLADRALERASE
ncbi:MAG: Glu/Leu/Phe/Val dehydrogenase family protein [Geodermatophilaceae bacterium]|nr:Glu/Leu/Phe/Val dehydrogenase family protein [Geodermatophilaceae bacterium]